MVMDVLLPVLWNVPIVMEEMIFSKKELLKTGTGIILHKRIIVMQRILTPYGNLIAEKMELSYLTRKTVQMGVRTGPVELNR